jgi:hypothetical protein
MSDNDIDDPAPLPSTSTSASVFESSSPVISKGKKGPIWNYFTKIDSKSSKCLICGKVLKTEFGSTSGIRKHLERSHHAQHRKFIDEDRNFKQSKETFSLVNKSETKRSALKTPKIVGFLVFF